VIVKTVILNNVIETISNAPVHVATRISFINVTVWGHHVGGGCGNKYRRINNIFYLKSYELKITLI